MVPSREYLAVRPLCGRNNIASSLKWVKAAAAAMLRPFSRARRGLQLVFSLFRVELMMGFRYLGVPEIVRRGKTTRHANAGSREVNQRSDRGGAARDRLLGNMFASLFH